MKVMYFSGKDLDANRFGEMSEAQKKQKPGSFVIDMSIFTIMTGLFAGATYITWQGSGGFNIAVAFVGCVFLACLALWMMALYAHIKGPQPQRVTAFTGRVRKHSGSRQNTLIVINHELETETMYDVSDAVYRAFLEGDTYTFYCLERTPTIILTSEHVSGQRIKDE